MIRRLVVAAVASLLAFAAYVLVADWAFRYLGNEEYARSTTASRYRGSQP